MTPARKRGILLAFFGMLLVSTDSLMTRLADTSAFDVMFWVGAFTAVVTFSSVVIRDRTTPWTLGRAQGRPLLVAAAAQAGSTAFFVGAVKETSVSNVVVILAAAPMVAAIVSWFWLKERTSAAVWAAIAATSVGIGIVISGSVGGGKRFGDLLAVAAILIYGSSVVYLRKHPAVHRPMIVGLGGLGMMLVSVIPANFGAYDLTTWFALFFMGALAGPAARIMLASAPKHLPAAEVGLFVPVETVFASIWAFLAFAEQPPPRTLIGGAVILGAVLFGVWPRTESVVVEAGLR